jgi:glyoxylase-like metal-dependent hydrolase (beta-lactamase superfamily II)
VFGGFGLDSSSAKEDTMALDRRQFIRLNAAALAGAALAPHDGFGMRRGVGDSTADPSRSPPGFYRFVLDDLEVTVLSDGSFRLPAEMFGEAHALVAMNVDPQAREEYFRSRLVPDDDLTLPVSPVVLGFGDRRVLVDTGMGPGGELAQNAGHLGAALELAGISPASIDLVVLTHAHPDHLGGLLHPTTRAPFFPKAEVVISDVELELWTADDAATRLQDWPFSLAMLPGIQEVLTGVNGQLRTVRAGDEVTGRLRSIPAPGHTPGHIALAVDAGEKEILLAGDALVTIHGNFEHPDWQFGVDLEPEQAARTRARLLDQAATDRMLILGYHFPFPGLGYALRDGEGYRWHPAGWRVLP